MSTLQGTAYESVADKPAVRVAEGESLRHVRLGGTHQGFYARAVKPMGDRLAGPPPCCAGAGHRGAQSACPDVGMALWYRSSAWA
jgi:hypothetical protein